jgi:hypothetical protein
MQFTHLTEPLQAFVGNKLICIGQMRPGGSNTPRSHLQESVTGTKVHRRFTVLHAIFHKLASHVLWVI